jgi:hypothetical protein
MCWSIDFGKTLEDKLQFLPEPEYLTIPQNQRERKVQAMGRQRFLNAHWFWMSSSAITVHQSITFSNMMAVFVSKIIPHIQKLTRHISIAYISIPLR